MNSYETLIHLSRYARWRTEDNRRETWDETVKRYCDFFISRTGSTFPMDDLYPAILRLDLVPSMRAMMTAGPALERDNIAGYNPVVGSTEVVTKEYGNIPIHLLSRENLTATVLNARGEWTTGAFKHYGKQKLYRVVTKLNSNTTKETLCTGNHRWLIDPGKVVSTLDLIKGNKIDFISAPKPEEDDDYLLGVRHGIIYGDGTAVKSCDRVKGYHIRLCGDSRELLRFFSDYPVTYPPSANGDPVVMMYDGFAATHSLKELPSKDETSSYQLGFIRGWLAADGSVSKTSQVSICTKKEGKGYLRKYAEKFGFVIQNERKQPRVTNYGERTEDSWVISISRSSCIKEDFLCSWKQANFRELESHWVVSSVEETDIEDDVYCAEVQDTNTFVLAGGLLTGNCSFVAIDNPRAFDEIMYILMCGTGVGFSVEDKYVRLLPVVAESLHPSDTTIIVSDSRIGWSSSLRELISLLYSGKVPRWDLSRVRGAGERLKTFGGRASGPEPLDRLFRNLCSIFVKAAGRRLTTLECHDIVTHIADVVIVGGVRRSALISLSDLEDRRLASAKSSNWWVDNPQRALANNSAVYNSKPDFSVFLEEWKNLYDSKSGERGIFNSVAARKQAESTGRRDTDGHSYGTNPCGEIILRNGGLCNLTEVIVRHTDTKETLRRKVGLATILGTFQSTLTDFRYLRKMWKNNADEERLLGVSLTGIFDNPITYNPDSRFLDELRQIAIDTNKDWASRLGIVQSAAITCVKPSGTVSQLAGCSSGIHPAFSRYYLRAVRMDNKDPICSFLKDQGVRNEPEVFHPDNQTVFYFPTESKGKTVDEISALEHLRVYGVYRKHWCEHNPSITVTYKDDEFMDVGSWVWNNWDNVGGIAFLPKTDHVYQQAPFTPITEEEYHTALLQQPDIDWSKYYGYETEDGTTATQELACVAGVCEV